MVKQFILLLIILIQKFNFHLTYGQKCFPGKSMLVEGCGCEWRYTTIDDDYNSYHNQKSIYCSILDKKVKILVDEKTLSVHCNLPQNMDINVEVAKQVNLKTLAQEVFFNRQNVEVKNCVVPLNTSVIPLLDNFHIKDCRSFLYHANVGSSLEWTFFDGFTTLEHLLLSDNNITLLQAGVFKAVLSSIKSLDLSRNELTTIPDKVFSYSLMDKSGFYLVVESALVELRLSYNKLTSISGGMFFNLPKVEELYLDHNYLQHIDCDAFEELRQLKILHLNDNQLTLKDCELYPIFRHLPVLTSLNLSNNMVTILPELWNKRQLSNLDFNFNRISSLTNEDLEFESKHVQVNLMNNRIKYLNFTNKQTFVETSSHSVKLLLNYNPVSCECNLQYFIDYKASRSIVVVADQLICDSPESVKGRQVQQMNSKNFTCDLDGSSCPQNCKCLRRPYDNLIVFNCSNSNLTVIPSIEMLNISSVELHVSENSSTNLPNSKSVPQNITVFDVSHNKIKTLNDSDFNALNELLKRKHIQQIAVSNNPWVCDDSQNFVKFVCQNEEFILDLKNTNCSSKGANFSVISKEFRSLCSDESSSIRFNTLVLVALLIPILFLIIFIVLCYEYQQEVKIWLYAHNLCLWFIDNEDSDEDKKYDAFISFTRQDEDFAIDTIVAELENGIPNFKTCVHVRDWEAGEFIVEAINKSVADSRRTIIILSPNFLKSVWGQYEFQCAHQKSIIDKRTRVIIIMYSDISNIDISDEALKSYLRTHSYITWGKALFWMKLRYALLH